MSGCGVPSCGAVQRPGGQEGVPGSGHGELLGAGTGLRRGPTGSRRAPLRAGPVLPGARTGGGIAPAGADAGVRADPARKPKW